MTTKQVGWYDGERVHQMNARPVGDVPQHLAHTAGWVAATVEDAPPIDDGLRHCGNVIGLALDSGEFIPAAELRAPLSPTALAEAQKFGDGMPVLPPPLQAEADAIGACCDPMSLEPAEPRP